MLESESSSSGRSGGESTSVNMSDCAVFGCTPKPGASMHYLPRNPELKQKKQEIKVYRLLFLLFFLYIDST